MLSVIRAEWQLSWVSFMLTFILCWVSIMLSVIYAECHLCWVAFKLPFMLSVIYSECNLFRVSFMLNVFYTECHLCLMSFIPNVTCAECHLCYHLCWVSLCWMSSRPAIQLGSCPLGTPSSGSSKRPMTTPLSSLSHLTESLFRILVQDRNREY